MDVHLFTFVMNGNDIRWDQNTTNLVKIFEDNFGVGFWHNFCIVYTQWGFDSGSERKRKRQGITKEKREQEVRKKIRGLFDASHVRPMYFVVRPMYCLSN